MSEALSLFVPRTSGVHRLHPLTKLTITGFLLIAGLVLPGIWTTYALFGIVLMPLALWGHVWKELLRLSWRVILPFAISVFLIQGFLWPKGTPLFYIGPFSLKIEGVIFAWASTGRILIVVSSFIWFALTTRPDTLMTALAQRGLPASLAYAIVSTIQIVPRFQARAATIIDAQRSRGLETEGNLLRRAQAIIPLVVPLILSSLVDVEERALAIEARAFNHPGMKTSLVEILETHWEPALRWIVLVATVGVLVFRLWFEFWI